jgi:ABC-type sugar transport system substrate-binding protein
VGKPIPTGKTIAYVNCGAQACVNILAGLKAAAAVLDWKIDVINSAPTPQAIQNSFQHAYDLHPDGVMSGGFAVSAYQRQLTQLVKAGIPVIDQNGTDLAKTGGLSLQMMYPAIEAKAGKLLADKMLLDQGGKGELGIVTLTGYPAQELLTKSVTDEISANCPGCSTKTLELAPTDIGTTAASKIANFLRANPGVKELYLSYDDLGDGLKAAVSGTGATYPKTVSWAPTQNGVAALQDGQRTAAVSQFQPEMGWQAADAFARLFTGQSPDPDNAFPDFFLWSQDYHNVPTTTANPVSIAGYQKQYLALWGKS